MSEGRGGNERAHIYPPATGTGAPAPPAEVLGHVAMPCLGRCNKRLAPPLSPRSTRIRTYSGEHFLFCRPEKQLPTRHLLENVVEVDGTCGSNHFL